MSRTQIESCLGEKEEREEKRECGEYWGRLTSRQCIRPPYWFPRGKHTSRKKKGERMERGREILPPRSWPRKTVFRRILFSRVFPLVFGGFSLFPLCPFFSLKNGSSRDDHINASCAFSRHDSTLGPMKLSNVACGWYPSRWPSGLSRAGFSRPHSG
jgi:hypothetical protein